MAKARLGALLAVLGFAVVAHAGEPRPPAPQRERAGNARGSRGEDRRSSAEPQGAGTGRGGSTPTSRSWGSRSAPAGGATWVFRATARRFGCEGALADLGRAAPPLRGSRVEYARPELREWYVESPQGIEQGFTIPGRPRAGGARGAAWCWPSAGASARSSRRTGARRGSTTPPAARCCATRTST